MKKTQKMVPPTPGDLNPEELEKQMTNFDRVPIWAMHPLTQHCLRIHCQFRPENVEWRSSDECRWVPVTRSPAMMFMEAYRIKPGAFDIKFLKEFSCLPSWWLFRSFRGY